MSKPFLTPADVARLLGVTTRRVYQLLGAGELPGIRLGGRHRIPRAAWDAWLEQKSDEALRRTAMASVSR